MNPNPPTKRTTRQPAHLPTKPLQLPAQVHYTKSENGRRILMKGTFHHCDDPFGNREFMWNGQALNSMSIFEFDNVIYVKPTTVQHQFKRDKKGMPISGKGWNAIFVSDALIHGVEAPSTTIRKPNSNSNHNGDATNTHNNHHTKPVRHFTLQHFRMSVGFVNNPALTLDERDAFCKRAREHYKSDAFITLLTKQPTAATSVGAPLISAEPSTKKRKRVSSSTQPSGRTYEKLTQWFMNNLPSLLAQSLEMHRPLATSEPSQQQISQSGSAEHLVPPPPFSTPQLEWILPSRACESRKTDDRPLPLFLL